MIPQFHGLVNPFLTLCAKKFSAGRFYAVFSADSRFAVKLCAIFAGLYDNSIAVIDLMLDDLRGKAAEIFDSGLEFLILVFQLNASTSARFARAGKRKASLLRFVGIVLPQDFRIVHHGVFALIIYGDDAFAHADHVRRHAHAAAFVEFQRVQKIVCSAFIRLRGDFRLLRQKRRIAHNFAYHCYTPF